MGDKSGRGIQARQPRLLAHRTFECIGLLSRANAFFTLDRHGGPRSVYTPNAALLAYPLELHLTYPRILVAL